MARFTALSPSPVAASKSIVSAALCFVVFENASTLRLRRATDDDAVSVIVFELHVDVGLP